MSPAKVFCSVQIYVSGVLCIALLNVFVSNILMKPQFSLHRNIMFGTVQGALDSVYLGRELREEHSIMCLSTTAVGFVSVLLMS